MAGTRNTIARWRRTRHVALMLCVQSVLVWIACCGVTLTALPGRDAGIEVDRGSVTFRRLPYLVPNQRGGLPYDFVLTGAMQWQRPRWLPAWIRPYRLVPASPLRAWQLTLPLWPVPAAFAGVAWYAGRRIKRLQLHGCATCGYDTRGLAVGVPCPECGGATR